MMRHSTIRALYIIKKQSEISPLEGNSQTFGCIWHFKEVWWGFLFWQPIKGTTPLPLFLISLFGTYIIIRSVPKAVISPRLISSLCLTEWNKLLSWGGVGVCVELDLSHLLPCSLISLDYCISIITGFQLFPSRHTWLLALLFILQPMATWVLFTLQQQFSILRPTHHQAAESSNEEVYTWTNNQQRKLEYTGKLVYSLPSHFPSASSIFWDDKLQVTWHILPLLYAHRGRWPGKLRVQEGTTEGQEKKVLSVTWVLVTQAFIVWIHMHADNAPWPTTELARCKLSLPTAAESLATQFQTLPQAFLSRGIMVKEFLLHALILI